MKTAILCLALALASSPALAQAYKCKTSNGVVFQSEPCADRATLRSATDYVSPEQHRQAVSAQQEVWRKIDEKSRAAMLEYQMQMREQAHQQRLMQQQRAAAIEQARQQELESQARSRFMYDNEPSASTRPGQLIDPYSGTVMNRGAGGYVDPRNGNFYQDAAGGVVNTRTGRFSPTTP